MNFGRSFCAVALCVLPLALACDEASPDTSEPGDSPTPTRTAVAASEDAPVQAAEPEPTSRGVDPPRPAAEQGPDPCGYLQQAEVGRALEVDVGAGQRSGRVCKWKPRSGPGSATLQVHHSDGQRIYDHERELLGVDEELSEIGDEAFRSGLVVGVRKGERFFSLALAPSIGGPMPKPPNAIELARQVASRL
jgi:hypothetical protein